MNNNGKLDAYLDEIPKVHIYLIIHHSHTQPYDHFQKKKGDLQSLYVAKPYAVQTSPQCMDVSI